MNRVSVSIAAAAALLMSCPPPPAPDACLGRVAGDLVISEVMIDPEGTDTGGEWVELFNTLGTPLDLKGLTLYVRDTDGSGAKTHAIRAGTAPARGYFVAGDIRSGPNPSWINYAYGDALGSMGNARGVVGIRCGMTTLAEFTYNSAAKPQRSRMLNGVSEPTSAVAAIEANYCDTPAGSVYFGNNAGTPGVANPVCQAEATSGTCVDNGTVRAMTFPSEGDLVINEVMTSPSAVSDTSGEWIELYARANVDLNDMTIRTSTSSTRVTSQTCLRVQSGEYVLLARSGEAFVNGGLPTPKYVYGALSLADTSQQLQLVRGDAGTIDSVSLLAATSGKAWQLDPTKQDPISNDDPANFCRAPERWVPDAGGDFGSPGVANPSCGNVIDCSGRAAGDLVITEVMLDPDSTDTGNEWIELFNTKRTDTDLTGLTLYKRNVDGTSEVTHSITGGSVTANGYFVMGDVRSGTNPAWINYAYGTGLGALANSSGVVGVRCGSLILAEFTYNTPAKSARSRMLDGVQTPTAAFAIEANYCDTPPGALYFGRNAGTPGAENPVCIPEATTGTCIEDGGMRAITSPNAGDVIITEVMADPTGTDTTTEWFEVLARAPVDLNDLTVYTSTSSARLTSGACLSVQPGEYVLLARSSDSFVNGDLPPPRIVYSGPSFANGVNQRIGLSRGDAGIDEIALGPSVGGRSWSLDPTLLDPIANDSPGNFCLAPNKWHADGGGDFGSPGTVNDACVAPGSCFDTSTSMNRPARPPPDGDLLITEWMSDPGAVGAANGEYFEFLAKSAFDLNGVRYRFGLGSTTPPLIVTSVNCLPATPNQYFLIGRNNNTAMNGNLPPLVATTSSALTSTTVVTLFNPDGGTADVVTTAGGAAGVSEQVNPNFLTPADNDTNHCLTPTGTVYGTSGNRGTPGVANVACP
ncbi:MAG: lamin tail domain-containing protein [Archangium sp.]|nr:lamin tail domain-containing protein [Archangium sp.]MDP3569180.1 lamin tail domain-containing protein [Archangium sp.]